MTTDEQYKLFYSKLELSTKKHGLKWFINKKGQIRTLIKTIPELELRRVHCCPMTAIDPSGPKYCMHFSTVGDHTNMSEIVTNITQASDHITENLTPNLLPIRKKILKILELKEKEIKHGNETCR